MRLLPVLSAVCLAAALPLGAAAAADGASQADFVAWARQHSKAYLLPGSEAEAARRYGVWAANVAAINARRRALAASGSSTLLGLNAHSDLTREEFRARFLGAPMSMAPPQHGQPEQQQSLLRGVAGKVQGLLRHCGQRLGRAGGAVAKRRGWHWRYEHVAAAQAVDWRSHLPPVLGPIKDQHINGTPCGSCWAFSAVSIMEISSALATGVVVSGSEQQLIDCDHKYDRGCSGGGWLNAIQYTIRNKGITEEDKYPYTGKDGACNKTLAHEKHALRVTSWEDVPYSNETAMAQALTMRPIIVAICVGPALDDWHAYKGGIFDAPCCEKPSEITLDHGIVVVGYGEEGGVPYWVLKNSWGATWGEQGFMRIRRNHGPHGKCALASFPTMVFRGKPPPPAAGGAGQRQQQQSVAAALALS